MLTRSDPLLILIPPQGLIVRESTDFYSVEDKLVASALAFIAANSHRPISQDETKTKYPPPPGHEPPATLNRDTTTNTAL